MAAYGVKTLIYSSTCATYGEPEKMPITEETPQVPINPYGKAKKMAEDIILDFSKNSNMAVMILRLLVNSGMCVCVAFFSFFEVEFHLSVFQIFQCDWV